MVGDVSTFPNGYIVLLFAYLYLSDAIYLFLSSLK